jgi:lactoylglutathione lyase
MATLTEPLPPQTTFATGHVGLNVTDLTRSKSFYQSVFGFTVAAEATGPDRAYAFLAQGDALVLTLWQQSAGHFAADRAGLHHLSFRVDSIEAVQAAERRLRELGAPIHHGGIVPHAEGVDSGGLFFEDPDGIRLEIFAPRGASGHGAAPSGATPTCGFF